ncbi:hypothetical protein PN836_002835 [Ningiella sp. W23]|uniref:hypothetical protein n=1 Tax=Ningiella sp. W23 TaxID=3023715 RepID=UPI0037582BD5
MTILKNKLALAVLVGLLALAGCSEAPDESEEDVESAVEQTQAATAEAYDDVEDAASDAMDDASAMLEDGKEAASEMLEEGKDKAAELLEDGEAELDDAQKAAAEKAKEACIKLKEQTGGDPSEC